MFTAFKPRFSRTRSLPATHCAAVVLALASAPAALATNPLSLRLTVPSRMVNSRTLTLRGELLDVHGRIDWKTWNLLGSVSATRVSDASPVPISITVFETLAAGVGGGVPPEDSIRFYNGVGSVSLTLDNGASEPPGDILIAVTAGSASASKVVSILDGADAGLFRNLSGTLGGADLTWSPGDGVIRLTGNVTVPTGETLTINPGTLVMVDSGAAGAGTAILAAGGVVHAIGTPDEPIAFFPTAGPAAMTLPQAAQNNPQSWRGFYHSGAGHSTYQWVIVAGAGNGVTATHPRPPIFRAENSHSIDILDCVVADCPGNGIVAYFGASGTYLLQRNLFSRCGIGGEFVGTGYTVIIEDSWYTRIGRAPEPNGVDGDIFHFDRPGNTSIVRRSILTDCGDDLIDHSTSATPIVEDSILYDARDKVVSLDGTGVITMTNCLVFDAPGNVRCAGAPAIITNCTFSRDSRLDGQNCTTSVVQSSIFWTTSIPTCCGAVNNSIVGNAGHLGCGVGNASTDPLFSDSGANNFAPAPGSPAWTAGPSGDQIGWLGFPAPGMCDSADDCDDEGDPCVAYSCDNGFCRSKFIICPPGILGDMNCDGSVDALDIPAFTLATIDPSAYALAYPGCNMRRGDTNGDFLVNQLDLEAFVLLVMQL